MANIGEGRSVHGQRKSVMKPYELLVVFPIMVGMGVAGLVLASNLLALAFGLFAGTIVFYFVFGFVRQRARKPFSTAIIRSVIWTVIVVALVTAALAFFI